MAEMAKVTKIRPRQEAAEFDTWPLPDRDNWPSYAAGLKSRNRRLRAQRTYSLFVWYCRAESRDLDTAAALAFIDALDPAYRLPSQIIMTDLLINALCRLRPDTGIDWFALRRRLAELRQKGKTDDARKARTGRERHLSIAFEDWPDQYKSRWRIATGELEQQSSPGVDDQDDDSNRYWEVVYDEAPERGESGAETRFAASTLKNVKKIWASWLWWCQHCGDVEPCVITQETLRQYVASMQNRGLAEKTMSGYVKSLHIAARLMLPERDWSWLGRIGSLMRKRAKPAKDKSEVVVSIEDVVKLGMGIFISAQDGTSAFQRAVQARDGLMIMLLAWRPVRLSNIQSMMLGENLQFDSNGDPEILYFPHSKNGERIKFAIPDPLKEVIRTYLQVYRPLLYSDPTTGPMWPGSWGEAMSAGWISSRLTRIFTAAFGQRFGPHMLRTIYAGSMTSSDPELREAVQAMLTHRDSQSTDDYLALAKSSYASSVLQREQDKVIKLPQSPKRKKRS